MTLIIQAMTISGKIVEGARWPVTSQSAFQRGQKVTIALPTKDPDLLGYLSKNVDKDCMLDADEGNYSVIISCVVSEVRHLVNIAEKNVESMVIVQPQNRLVEHVIQYVLQPTKCDPRFTRIVKGGLANQG